jgi:hypothetical protein
VNGHLRARQLTRRRQRLWPRMDDEPILPVLADVCFALLVLLLAGVLAS